jgi:hypothetical protein
VAVCSPGDERAERDLRLARWFLTGREYGRIDAVTDAELPAAVERLGLAGAAR